MAEDQDDEKESAGKYTRLVFECAVCKKVYKKPGVCKICDTILKPSGG
ncbi:MAG: hypothetical protein HYW23_02600 [Candidatus Aenigmarchaeota archaeon]|nr:hypothetical protein [Candidatus Aenigmarchaeota archaeon]